MEPEPPPPGPEDRARLAGVPVSRRRVLAGAALAAGAATVGTFWFEDLLDPTRRSRILPTAEGAPGKALWEAESPTRAAVQDRLFPSAADGPGAKDVNAIGYLDAVLASDELDDWNVKTIRGGAAALDERARARSAASFAALPPETMDALLRALEAEPKDGVPFLERMLVYVFEALFGDPVHGVNLDEKGWKWAEHVPGRPRPAHR